MVLRLVRAGALGGSALLGFGLALLATRETPAAPWMAPTWIALGASLLAAYVWTGGRGGGAREALPDEPTGHAYPSSSRGGS